MESSSSDPLPKDDLKALQSEDLYLYGLIGNPLTHSFSQQYFMKKFKKEKLKDHHYELFPLDDIDDIRLLLEVHKNLCGLNVTIPYKESIIEYLDDMDPVAAEIGAVNCILIDEFEKIGYNTDWLGFRDALKPHLKAHHTHALVLGTGGSSKAVQYALKELEIQVQLVSRNAGDHCISYSDLTKAILEQHTVIINTTPLGMHPDTATAPDLDYSAIGKNHLCFDLIYNPAVTQFLQRAKNQGATVVNGERMLELQAEYAWSIWSAAQEEAEDED